MWPVPYQVGILSSFEMNAFVSCFQLLGEQLYEMNACWCTDTLSAALENNKHAGNELHVLG